RICEKHGYQDLILSMKSSNPKVMVAAYRLLAARMTEEGMDYPFHLGVTEAGYGEDGRIKSAIGIGSLLNDGIGDTIRVSLTDDPVEEVKVGNWILQSLGLKKRGLDLVACPSCGRAEVDVLGLTKQVNEALEREGLKAPIRVAVMGCVVNGPGEAREADLGIAAGKGYGQLIIRGEVRDHRIPEDKIVEVVVEEARKMAREKELEAAGATTGES
ncbi:MAG TPA: flavodoxin-dependent (E)-4-hydroxy-3-methylbut-2-enyl-diphosphate synthase, partial [Actinomycetota bacterium]|nr:flavodoxin-dependent (E)-4-hydroxy-3-methylbut-2-enyl-diphosphate synthase [Actinomycetota bacterium]